MCSLIPDPNERHQCYSVFGLDAQRMNNYYETVVRLEQQLSSDIDNHSGKSRLSAGFARVCMWNISTCQLEV